MLGAARKVVPVKCDRLTDGCADGQSGNIMCHRSYRAGHNKHIHNKSMRVKE